MITDSEIVARLIKCADGKPIVPGWSYWTKTGCPVSVQLVPIYNVTVPDGNGMRTCTEADIYSEPPAPLESIHL